MKQETVPGDWDVALASLLLWSHILSSKLIIVASNSSRLYLKCAPSTECSQESQIIITAVIVDVNLFNKTIWGD
jgi:hypothetical protein